MASDELFAKLHRRNQIIEAAEDGQEMNLPTESIAPGVESTSPTGAQVEGDLADKLQRRNKIIDSDEQGMEPELPSLKVFNPYTEFKEFSRKEIKNYQKMFNQ